MAEVARGQRGLVTHAELVACGVSDSTISRWVRAGRLVRVYRGVYLYGQAALTPAARWLAAVLACGPDAVLSQRSAAMAWGLLTTARERIDVAAGGRGRRIALVDAHGVRLHASERTVLDGIPITTPMRTLVDLAAVERPPRLAQAVENAERLRLLDVAAIDATLARIDRPRGVRALEAALRKHRPEHGWTRSGLERAVLALVERRGLPRPRVNAFVEGHEVDLHWPAARVVAELDTPGFHGTTAAFERDRARDADLTAAGYRVIRITGERMDNEDAAVAALLERLLRPPGDRRTPGRASPRRRTRGQRRPAGRRPAA